MREPLVFDLVGRSSVTRRVLPLWCRRYGCRWEQRTGYDWCPRCRRAAWHLAAPYRSVTVTPPAVPIPGRDLSAVGGPVGLDGDAGP